MDIPAVVLLRVAGQSYSLPSRTQEIPGSNAHWYYIGLSKKKVSAAGFAFVGGNSISLPLKD
jgi:hypothetical protein